jgi:hypothetical protein
LLPEQTCPAAQQTPPHSHGPLFSRPLSQVSTQVPEHDRKPVAHPQTPLVQTELVPQLVPLGFGLLTQPFTGSQVTELHASPAAQLQLAHTLLPAALEYVPDGQGLQVVAPTEANVPGGQVEQALAAAAPVLLDAEPAGHGVQTLLPVLELYEPAAHGVQALLPELELKEPVAQGVHCDCPLALA